jgi:Aldehyde dehydrogenase family
MFRNARQIAALLFLNNADAGQPKGGTRWTRSNSIPDCGMPRPFLAARQDADKWRDVGAVSGKTFEIYNPATGAVFANAPEADKADVDIAVAAARRAFDNGVWAKVSPSEKGRMLWRIADLIERDLEELAELESIDNGKPYAVARVADSSLGLVARAPCVPGTGSRGPAHGGCPLSSYSSLVRPHTHVPKVKS